MEFNWISPEQAAEKWGITPRQVQALCKMGKISGVVNMGRFWLIPKETLKPVDRRTKSERNKRSEKENNCGTD